MKTTAPLKSAAAQKSDPSALTTDAVHREIEHLRELLEGRLNGMDEAVKILHQDMVRVPTELDKATGSLRELLEAKIKGWVDLHQAKIDAGNKLNKERIHHAAQLGEVKTACLQRELNKSERIAKDQVDSLEKLMRSNDSSCDAKVDDIRNRLTLIEGARTGGQTVDTRNAVNWGLILGGFSALTGLAILIVMAFGKG